MVFLRHASVRSAVPGDAAEFEEQLRCAWEVGRDAWPQLDIPADVFVRHLAERLTPADEGKTLAQVLAERALGDLYLACAWVHGVLASSGLLESRYLAKLPVVLGFLKLPAMVLDEVCQLVRIEILMGGASGGGPRIAGYNGKGALLSWIRIMAVRLALKEVAAGGETPNENLLALIEALPDPGADLELDIIKRRYRSEFRQAVYESFASLPWEQRHSLQLYFIDRLSTTEMARLFGMSQSNVSRRLKRARQAVYQETKRRLQERLALSSTEFTSLVDAIKSDLDLRISQVFTEES
ncbi:MAG TPA: sigma-70 family RNA polymerase sigma factor [Archangium sp.]|uniref:sigma-70 family RNA polymerase sigma factor n=1 Tax=Archangium sp. TaxID=1872627 RepID=UPI002E31EE11|nr:sigma-70 family RNA polymerase sigma factor [Archangium sp.]HEX5748798.1 sigma-70 family RNA polymerase sigma factor [Archangium sp.]